MDQRLCVPPFQFTFSTGVRRKTKERKRSQTSNQHRTTVFRSFHPTGVVQDDILFAYIGHVNSTDRLTTPSGWTQIGRNKNGSANQALFYKIAGASEPASYTFNLSVSSRFGASIVAPNARFPTQSLYSNVWSVTSWGFFTVDRRWLIFPK